MNTTMLTRMLDSYIIDFDANWENEDYKWIEVKHFQNNFNLECAPELFVEMLKQSICVASNLFASNMYYPIDEVIKNANEYPKEVQNAVSTLLDENVDIYYRVESYRTQMNLVKAKTGLTSNDGLDIRFISTLLSFRYPDKYTIYKFTEQKKFCEQFDLGITIKAGETAAIEKAVLLTDLLIDYLKENNHPVIEKYRDKLNDQRYYSDSSLRMLAQNIIWYATKYLDGETPPEDGEMPVVSFNHGSMAKSNYHASIVKDGTKTDFIKVNQEKKKVGDLGESFVIEYENARLQKIGKKASWQSKNKGDGLGYDILSYDDYGNEKYIEVKTTTNSEKATFFITATELAACREYGDAYYLYRVFKEDNEWCIAWYRGKEIEALCNCPCQYAVCP